MVGVSEKLKAKMSMNDTDTNGADLDVITILLPEDDCDDYDGAAFAAELGRRARRQQIERGEL